MALGLTAVVVGLMGTGAAGALPGSVQTAFERAAETVSVDLPAADDERSDPPEGQPRDTQSGALEPEQPGTASPGPVTATPTPTTAPATEAQPAPRTVRPVVPPPGADQGEVGLARPLRRLLDAVSDLVRYAVENLPPGSWVIDWPPEGDDPPDQAPPGDPGVVEEGEAPDRVQP